MFNLSGTRYILRASTPIDISRLNQELISHPDIKFVNNIIQGLSEGFSTGISCTPVESYSCNNSLKARNQPDAVSRLLEEELNKGYIIGPFEESPFHPFRINPLGIAEGKYSKKLRLIVDLSAPHNNAQQRTTFKHQ